MTINTTNSRVSYNGNGVTTSFAVPYYFAANGDLVAILNKVDGTQVTWVLGTNYTLTGAGNPTGTLAATVAPATGETLVIYRDPAATQLYHFVDNDPLPAASIEGGLDKATTLAQRALDLVGRSLRLNDGDPATTAALNLPPAAQRANKYLSFDAAGIPTTTTFDITTVQDAAATAVASAAAASTSAANAATSATSAASSASAAATQAAIATTTASSVAPTVPDFSGDGTTVSFDLGVSPPAATFLDVFVGGVRQYKSQWSLAGSTLTFNTAPAAGTNNIEVKVAGTIAAVINAANADYGLITAAATSFADYGAVF